MLHAASAPTVRAPPMKMKEMVEVDRALRALREKGSDDETS
jgi:hypothetical protein